jgi:hypothetical protein
MRTILGMTRTTITKQLMALELDTLHEIKDVLLDEYDWERDCLPTKTALKTSAGTVQWILQQCDNEELHDTLTIVEKRKIFRFERVEPSMGGKKKPKGYKTEVKLGKKEEPQVDNNERVMIQAVTGRYAGKYLSYTGDHNVKFVTDPGKALVFYKAVVKAMGFHQDERYDGKTRPIKTEKPRSAGYAHLDYLVGGNSGAPETEVTPATMPKVGSVDADWVEQHAPRFAAFVKDQLSKMKKEKRTYLEPQNWDAQFTQLEGIKKGDMLLMYLTESDCPQDTSVKAGWTVFRVTQHEAFADGWKTRVANGEYTWRIGEHHPMVKLLKSK